MATTDTDLTKRIDDLIKQVTDRNKTVQEKKKSGPWGWIVGGILALISLVGIGVVMFLANRRAKELAKLKTQVEQAKVDQDQKAAEAKKEPLHRKREELLTELKRKEREIQEQSAVLRQAEQEHAERKKRIDALNAWAEINDA